LPADAVVTERTSGRISRSRAMALAAPRSLNEPVPCTISSFSQTSAPVTADSHSDRISGVRQT
jgi:hypothetical protein